MASISLTASDRLPDRVRDVLASARSYDPAPRTPGFLINYGLLPRTAQALVRGGWSTVSDVDTTERAWRTAVDHGANWSLHAWLRVPQLGVSGADDVRQALVRWREHRPQAPSDATRGGRVATAILGQIAAGEVDHGQILPAMAALARVHAVRPTEVVRAYDVLALAGWCAWRDRHGPVSRRERPVAVALLPGAPYDAQWAGGTATRVARRATDAVELLRHNPGAWQHNDTRHTLRGLAPIADVVFDDAGRVLTATVQRTRRTTRRGTPNGPDGFGGFARGKPGSSAA